MASSALPNLSALRLAEAARRVDTEEWVQYDPSLQRVVDNEDLQECPICALRFDRGDWLWKTNRGPSGAFQYYTPREYWKALKSRNGVDPMMSDIPVSDDDVKELVDGPPGELHDLIDDPPTRPQLEALLVQWREAREGRVREIQAEDVPVVDGNAWPESLYETLEQASLTMDVENMPWNIWMSKLLVYGLTLRHLEHLATRVEPAEYEMDEIVTVRNLQINEALLDYVRDVNRLANQPLRWHMPFYQLHLDIEHGQHDRLNHDDRGVRYEWRPLGGPNMSGPRASTFRLVARMHHRSPLATFLEKRIDSMNYAMAEFPFSDINALRNRGPLDYAIRKALLRGFFPNATQAFVDWLYYHLDHGSFKISLVTNGGEHDEDFELSLDVWPELMAWMCQDWPDSRPTRTFSDDDDVFDYPLPRPPYADLCTYGADRPFATVGSGDWSNPQSKQLWERAVGKLSTAMTTLIYDMHKWRESISDSDHSSEIHLPDRPFRPVATTTSWRQISFQNTDLYPVVECREMLWYAVGESPQEE